jgi:hypothetical protein
MNWQRIRELHPHSWVVIEALDGRTEDSKRIIDTLSLLGVHGNTTWNYIEQIPIANFTPSILTAKKWILR